MRSVVLNMSMSLDGFVAGPDVGDDAPMGVNGERLHDWIRGTDPIDAEVSAQASTTIGAVVIGRRMFDIGHPYWDGTPYPHPTFVLTHEGRPDLVTATGTFTFVTDGIESASAMAKTAAGERDVTLMGGANVARQALRGGLVDELRLQLVPVLLGSGARLFDAFDPLAIEFEQLEVVASPSVTHLRYRVVRDRARPA